jgi:5-methylcytosine-specific restriction endonuclease McrA
MARNPIIRENPTSIRTPEEIPHACYDGWVFLGFEGEDENGELVEVLERVPCRRCEGTPQAAPDRF